MLDSEVRKAAPVALAILFRSAFLHLLTAMAPASTKYYKQQAIQLLTGKYN
jgi:type III secretory pathway component EscT